MPSFTRHAFSAMDEADIVLEVVDARFASMMRHHTLENHLRSRKIPFILVLNKVDLLQGRGIDESGLKYDGLVWIPIACAPKRNINRLRSLIFSRLEKGGKIAVVGYPNTGKSSVINALAGRKAAPTSKQAGFTKGRSMIKLKEGVYLIDTPGVIPLDEYDQFTLMLFNAKSPNQLRDVQGLAMKLLEWLPTQKTWSDWLVRTYGVQLTGDGDEQLDALAVHLNILRKGGVPDLHAVSIRLIHDWQSGLKGGKE